MKFEELAGLIKSRRSIRRWEEREVDPGQLVRAVELATWAPNGGNRQSWRFYIIMKKAVIASIAGAVQDSADEMASWQETGVFGPEAAGWAKRAAFFRSAPAAIAVAVEQYQSVADKILAARGTEDPRANQMRAWRNSANSRIQSVSSAIAYLLLALHQMGLGAVWMTGPMQVKGEIEKILGIPQGMDLVAFIPVGHPAESPDPGGRLPVDKVIDIIK